jgi:hypothetical protein
VEDNLSGISPELVLIDPDLARLVRERQVDEASLSARRSTLRLVEGGPAESPIVPRTVDTAPPAPASPSVETVTSSVPAPVVEPPREEVAPVASSAPTPVVAEPIVDALPVPAPEPGAVARRVIEAEPARAVPSPDVEAPAPLVPDRLADVTLPPAQPTPGFSTMPHPVARPATQRRARPTVGRRKRGRPRGILAFLVAVAIASAAVLGITRLTAGSSESPSGKGGTAAVGAPPVAAKSGTKSKAASSGKTVNAKKASSKPKPKPKPTATKPSVTKPSVTKPSGTQKTSGANASTKPKTTATAKPRPQATVKPKPQTTTAKPKAAATPPKKTPAVPAETRRFAWAPVDGAVGYHVELFRGNDRVLAKDTKEPVLELEPTWRDQGRTVTLTPGEYRWYVWPVTASGRGTQAVVQAKLTV